MDARTVDTSHLEAQPGDEDVRWFSFDPQVYYRQGSWQIFNQLNWMASTCLCRAMSSFKICPTNFAGMLSSSPVLEHIVCSESPGANRFLQICRWLEAVLLRPLTPRYNLMHGIVLDKSLGYATFSPRSAQNFAELSLGLSSSLMPPCLASLPAFASGSHLHPRFGSGPQSS